LFYKGILCLYKTSEVFMGISLITKAEYKTYMGISSTNSDTEIDFLIPKVSELVKSYCRRTFVDYYDEAKIEFFDGGFKTLLLKEAPVVGIVSVARSTNYGKSYTPLTKYTDWVNQGDAIVSLTPGGFPELINGYRVTYNAGYDLAVFPADLKLAVLDLVEYYSRNNGAVHSSRDLNPNTTQISYVSTTNLPAPIKRVLDQYVADFT
jgi:hypothetical protein